MPEAPTVDILMTIGNFAARVADHRQFEQGSDAGGFQRG